MAKVRKRTSPKFQTTPETVNETPNDRNCDDGPSQSNDERGNAFLHLLTRDAMKNYYGTSKKHRNAEFLEDVFEILIKRNIESGSSESIEEEGSDSVDPSTSKRPKKKRPEKPVNEATQSNFQDLDGESNEEEQLKKFK